MPSLLAVLGLDATQFQSGAAKAKTEAAALGSAITGSLNKGIGSIGSWATGLLTVSAVLSKITGIMEDSSEIRYGSAEMGISPERYQDLKRAADRSRISIDDVRVAYSKLADTMIKAQEGNDKAIAALKLMGITVKELKHLSADEAFERINRYMSGVGQVSADDVAAMRAIFGRGSARLVGGMIEGKFNEGAPWKMSPAEYQAGQGLKQRMREGNESWWGFRQLSRDFYLWFDALRATAGEALTGNDYSEWLARKHGFTSDSIIPRGRLAPGASLAQISAEDKAQEEANKKAKKSEEERARLENQTAEAQWKNYLEQLTAEQKLKAIEERRLGIRELMAKITDPEKLQLAMLDMEKLDAEALAAAEAKQREIEALKGKGKIDLQVNQLQKIGAYVSDPLVVSQVDLARKSEQHLSDIRRAINKLAGAGTTGGGVTY